MQAGDLVRHKRSESGRLGVITKRGYGKARIAWIDGWSSWCIFSMLEVVNESR